MKLAIITARGGSKRIPRKNIRMFSGKPIIAYSIEAAIAANCFDEVMVSTDDQEIADISKEYGAKVPFFRSKETASDSATTVEVLIEVLSEYKKQGLNPTYACCIYPTAPFVTGNDLNKAWTIFSEHKEIKTVLPIVRFSYPIQRALRLEANKVSLFNPEHISTRSQDLEPGYHDAGQFYWFQVSEFVKTKTLFGTNTAGIILPEWQVQDIDNEDDWILAEMKYQFIQKKKLTL